MISFSEYISWKHDPVTEAYMEACKVRIEDGKDTLATQAGIDPIYDSYVRGIIRGYTEMLEFKVEDLSE
jgi:hypothetical protein